jgi:spore maturation protein CgeB
MVFTNERTSAEPLRRVNPHTYYLPHAWHPGVHQVMSEAPGDVPAHDVVFVGTGFVERLRLLEQMDWTGIDFGLYGVWTLAASRSKVRPFLRGEETPNAKTAALYRAARVGLNLHRTSKGFGLKAAQVAGAESMNPRCYELAACGVFFTTDARAEVGEVFGDALPTFTTAAEAEAIVRRALREPQWRADVAAACRERVTDQTWTARAAMVLDALARYSAAQAASRKAG